MYNKIFASGENQKNTVDIENVYFFLLSSVIYILNFQTETKGNVITNILIGGFIGIEILNLVRQGRFKANKYLMTLCLFVFLSLMSAIYSVVTDMTFVKVKTVLLNVIFVFALLQFFSSLEKIKFGLYSLEIGGFLAGMYSILNSSYYEGERTSDVIGNANTAAIYLSYAAIIAMYFITQKKKIVIHLGMFSTIVFSILITGSRSGFIILAVGLIMVLFYFLRINRNFIVKLVIIFSVIIGIILLRYIIFNNPLMYDILGKRFESLFEILSSGESSTGENSTLERWWMIQVAFQAFLDSPIFGCGLGGVGHFIEQGIGRYTFCHNNYMEILSGLGIVGFVTYYSVHVRLIVEYYKERKNSISDIRFLALILLICILVSHMFIVHYYYKLEFLFLGFIIKSFEICVKNEENN